MSSLIEMKDRLNVFDRLRVPSIYVFERIECRLHVFDLN